MTSASMVRARCASRSFAALSARRPGWRRPAGRHAPAACPGRSSRSGAIDGTGRFTLHRGLLSPLVPKHRSLSSGRDGTLAALARLVAQQSGPADGARSAAPATSPASSWALAGPGCTAGGAASKPASGVSTLAADAKGSHVNPRRPVPTRLTRHDRRGRKCQWIYVNPDCTAFRPALVCCPGSDPAMRAPAAAARRGAPPAVHPRGARPPRRLALDAGAGRARAAAVPGLPGQPRAWCCATSRPARACARPTVSIVVKTLRALHDHGHRRDLGERRLRPLPVRPGLLLGRRVQHAGAGAAHRLPRGAAHRRARRRGSRCCSRSPPMPPTSSTPRSSC